MKDEESIGEATEEQEFDIPNESIAQEQSVEEEEEIDPRLLLTKEQLQYFKFIFDQLDVLQKKRIPVSSVGFILRYLGFNPTKEDIQRRVNEIDPSHKGLIDFYAFLLPIAQTINHEQPSHEEIIEAFKVFADEDNDSVNVEPLIEALTTLSEELDDIEVETFLKMADPKGSGKINYMELIDKIFGLSKPQKKDKKGKKKDKKK